VRRLYRKSEHAIAKSLKSLIAEMCGDAENTMCKSLKSFAEMCGGEVPTPTGQPTAQAGGVVGQAHGRAGRNFSEPQLAAMNVVTPDLFGQAAIDEPGREANPLRTGQSKESRDGRYAEFMVCALLTRQGHNVVHVDMAGFARIEWM